jgi:hypothetical protein
MGLVISKGLTLRKGWQPMDTDAAAYITAVETADGQALEEKTKIAIDNFILGCKADGIWNAIKASCILAGARTLNGALQPLVGTAPTNFNFASGDYNRKTGLVGDGGTKYLDSNRNNSAEPQNSKHISTFVSTPQITGGGVYIGAGRFTGGASVLGSDRNINVIFTRVNSQPVGNIAASSAAAGFIGASRSDLASYLVRVSASNSTIANTSETQRDRNFLVFARDDVGVSREVFSSARLAFYSIGESLNLAILDARVTDLINAFGAAIP